MRFTDVTNKWKAGKWAAPDYEYNYHHIGYFAEQQFFEHNGYLYTAIRREWHSQLVMYVREDTQARKIYVIPVDWDFLQLDVTDTGEFLYIIINRLNDRT